MKNCYEALPEDGKVIMAEYVPPAAPGTGLAAKIASQIDFLMSALNPGTKEGTPLRGKFQIKKKK